MGRRWIPPHGRPSSIKRLQIHPNCKTGIQAPFKNPPLPCTLSSIPHPRFRVLCQLPWFMSAHNHHIPKAFSALSTQCQTLVFVWNPFVHGILSRTKPSLCEILDICRYPNDRHPVSLQSYRPRLKESKKSFPQTWPASPSCLPAVGGLLGWRSTFGRTNHFTRA